MNESPTRLLALDFGDRRTGVAATDATGTIELPLPALVGLDDRDLGQAVRALCAERDTDLVVVGVPYQQDGGIGVRAQRCLDFARHLEKVLDCPVATVDESWTTEEAHRTLADAGVRAARRKHQVDSLAALMILRRYRDA